MARRIKGGIKRKETDPASNQFLNVLPHLEHTKRFTELGREEKEEGGERGDWWRKRRVQRGREQSSQ